MAGSKKETTKVKEDEKVIIFKANKPLTKDQYELLSTLVASESKKKGVKIVLMPYSCDLVEEHEQGETGSDEHE